MLNTKTRAAAASGCCVRIIDLECGADEFSAEVDF